MGSAFLHVIYASIFLICSGDGYKILAIFPWPAKSRFTCNNAIMKSLIDSGHEVTVLTSFPEQASAENYSSVIDVSEKNLTLFGKSKYNEWTTQNPFEIFEKGIRIGFPYCSKVLNSPEIQRILKSDKKLYDVVFVEILFFYKCFLPVAEKLNIPVIATVTTKTRTQADHAINNPNNPACIPYEILSQKRKLDHIFGRITNLLNHLASFWYENFVVPNMLKQFHNDHTDQLRSFGKYLDMEPNLIFYNNHASLFSRPMNPNAVEIGGIHIQGAKPLPTNIQKFIDEAEHGVILFTLGSVVRAATLPFESQKAFTDAFAELPQRIIWKFEEKIEHLSSNVMMLDWLPQRDILEHENVIAFISHCGLGGVNEAVYTATPVVACPLFGDQPGNADILEDMGAAVRLDIHEITKQNVLNALNSIINDTRFYNNMQKLSKKFKDRPMTPQQSVVYWTEYVIRHQGASHLKSPAAQLSWFQFLMLDIVLVIVTVLVISVYLLFCVVRIFSSYFAHVRFFNRFNKPNSKKL
ncbi:UDP-glucosyltransferase 2-like isoform X2 [Planococcus citri]|uniref:UDP-glucosyltransferase 2-like isoform X2 n=1 Tax=Planococcus citri TaxID=170843 RepID=UPI0031F93F64